MGSFDAKNRHRKSHAHAPLRTLLNFWAETRDETS
jgi:hypothetical protein